MPAAAGALVAGLLMHDIVLYAMSPHLRRPLVISDTAGQNVLTANTTRMFSGCATWTSPAPLIWMAAGGELGACGNIGSHNYGVAVGDGASDRSGLIGLIFAG
jgi:hypothetical protein